MSLRERILVILLILFCGYVAIEYAASRRLMYPIFVHQERQQAQDSVDAVLNAVNARFSEIQRRVAARASSGDFYAALQYAVPLQIEKESEKIDFILLYDYRWNLIRSILPENLPASRLEEQLVGDRPALISKDLLGFSRSGLVKIDRQLAFVAAEPIMSSTNTGFVEGTAIAGRFITDNTLVEIRKQFHLDYSWDFLSDETKLSRNADVIRRITVQDRFHFSEIGRKYFQASSVLFDNDNQPAILIKTFHSRAVSDQGMLTLYKLLVIKLGVGFLALLFLTALLQIVVVNPIVKLIRHIVRIEHPGSAKEMLALSRKDEIGTLAAEFEQMCRRVQNAQIKLMEKSYVSGATEMSSGILHNVRNALSPITTRIDRIKDRFHEIPLEHLEQAQRELHGSALGPQRREDLMRFVELTFQSVIATLREMVTGLDELFEQVVQIEDMLNTQRTFGSRKDSSVEYIDPIQLVGSAIEIVPEQLRNKKRIDISTSVKKLPQIPVQPTAFVQILQNLLINAAESLEREKPLYPKISIHCEIEPHETVDMLHWFIRDNGAGIEQERLDTIFERGASSKVQGLTGIGLHWCAVTINAMQGRLWAESEGKHRGACFHLLIPMSAAECAAANTNDEG